tara:strand:- start:2214 stop:3260 length:1047 start_codon:yes stop_codon:yes gene_type:complete
MKLFITGGCGFIGSNFILQNTTHNNNLILNYDSLSYSGNVGNLSAIENGESYSFINGDICDKNLLKTAILNFKPDIVVHFAAESHVDRSIDSPIEFVNTNIIGTVNLLTVFKEYLKQENNSARLIHISTDEVYGSLGMDGVFNESSPFKPNSPYAASKACSDLMVRSWIKTYNFPAIITHCSNNYGPYQFPEKLIPLMIMNCLNDKALPIYGNGENIRDWLFVEDHCSALSLIIQDGKIGETYNIGGSNEVSNKDIVLKICSIMDKIKPRSNSSSYKELITYVKDRPGHDFRYAIDSSKIRNELKWKPIQSFESGLKKTIEWYLANENWLREIQKNHYNQERLGLSGL